MAGLLEEHGGGEPRDPGTDDDDPAPRPVRRRQATLEDVEEVDAVGHAVRVASDIRCNRAVAVFRSEAEVTAWLAGRSLGAVIPPGNAGARAQPGTDDRGASIFGGFRGIFACSPGLGAAERTRAASLSTNPAASPGHGARPTRESPGNRQI